MGCGKNTKWPAFRWAIEAQNGKPAYRDMALNLLKGLLAVSLFTVVPVELFKFCISLQVQLGEAITRTFYMERFDGIGAIAQRILHELVYLEYCSRANELPSAAMA